MRLCLDCESAGAKLCWNIRCSCRNQQYVSCISVSLSYNYIPVSRAGPFLRRVPSATGKTKSSCSMLQGRLYSATERTLARMYVYRQYKDFWAVNRQDAATKSVFKQRMVFVKQWSSFHSIARPGMFATSTSLERSCRHEHFACPHTCCKNHDWGHCVVAAAHDARPSRATSRSLCCQVASGKSSLVRHLHAKEIQTHT